MTFAYPTNISGVAGLASWANIVTDSWFWTMILFALFVILFFSMKLYSTERAFAASSFITMIIAILIGSIGLLKNGLVLTAFIILGGLGLVVLWATNHKSYG